MNSTELQTALNDTGANHGGDYILKGGDYEVSGMITIPSFTRLICQGNVRFIPTKAIDILFFMKDTEYSGILGGRVVPNGTFKISSGAFIYGNSHDCMIERYYAEGTEFGILVQATPQGVRPWNNFISRNTTLNCGTGCYVEGADKSHVEDNNFAHSLNVGLLIGNSNIGTLSGNICAYNATHGTYLSGCKEFSLIGEHYCFNGGAGLHVRFYPGVDPANPVKDENNTILGGNYNYNGGNGIHFQEWVNHCTVDGAVCRGNKAVGLRMHGEGCTGNRINVLACDNKNGQITDENVGNIVTHNVER